jgi:hypothetical protein
MRLRPLVLAFGLVLGTGSSAWAQMQLTSSSAPALETMSVGAGRSLTTRGLASGLKLGDGNILHAGVFADIGYDSNVFYGSSSDGTERPSPVLHVTPRLELTNAERDGTVPTGTYYDLVGSVDFRWYLKSGSDKPAEDVRGQSAINPTVGGTAVFSSGQALSFTLNDTFSRSQQAPYAEGNDPITRNDNMASASLNFAPGGGRLRVMLRYNNLIDKYEGTYDSGSNMGNEGSLDISWRWLPRTSLYAQVAQGAISYFNTGHTSSYPLRTLLGIRGLLTEKLSVNLAAGYSNAFYSGTDSPSGFGNVGIVGEVNYLISLLSRAGFGYHHDFVNSPFLGGYYNMDAVYGMYQQMIASRLVTYLYGRFENRRYGEIVTEKDRLGNTLHSITNRADNNVIAGAAVDYMIGNFLMLGASYSLNLNRTLHGSYDDVGNGPGPLNYTKHVLLFRVGAVY